MIDRLYESVSLENLSNIRKRVLPEVPGKQNEPVYDQISITETALYEDVNIPKNKDKQPTAVQQGGSSEPDIEVLPNSAYGDLPIQNPLSQQGKSLESDPEVLPNPAYGDLPIQNPTSQQGKLLESDPDVVPNSAYGIMCP